VDLTKKLVPDGRLTVRVDVPTTSVCKYDVDYRVEVKRVNVRGLQLTTNYSTYVRLITDDDEGFELNLFDPESLYVLEDVVTYLVELYKKAEETLSTVVKYNDGIMKEMAEVVAPYRIARSIQG